MYIAYIQLQAIQCPHHHHQFMSHVIYLFYVCEWERLNSPTDGLFWIGEKSDWRMRVDEKSEAVVINCTVECDNNVNFRGECIT